MNALETAVSIPSIWVIDQYTGESNVEEKSSWIEKSDHVAMPTQQTTPTRAPLHEADR